MATASDDFNRADDSTGLGADWTLIGSPAVWIILNNQARTPQNGDPGSAWRNDITPGDAQFSEIVVGEELDTIAGFGGGPAVRMATGADTCYCVMLNTAAAEEVGLYEVTAGSAVQLGFYNGGAAPTAGDIIRLEANGSTIRVLVNAVERISVTDASISSGRVGLRGEAEIAYSFMQSWTGGDLAADPPITDGPALVRVQSNLRW